MPATLSPPTRDRISLGEASRVWARIGLLGFGGPAGQIALMHKELVERRRWLSESRFLHALNYCMLLPGPEAQQLATYIGWLLHKTAGGLVAGILFVLPGFVAILLLSVLYAGFHTLPAVVSLFFGLKAAVLAIVVEAVIRLGKRALKTPAMVALAALAFSGIFFFAVPFPVIVVAAGLLGLLGSAAAPRAFAGPPVAADAEVDTSIIDAMLERGELAHTRPQRARALRVIVVCLGLWWAPLVALAAFFGASSVFVEQGVFFSKTAVVTFGGAYAVLAYVAQRAVDTYGWLKPGEMLDGLGMAETTPGPLIMVLQFVAFMGAFRNPGALNPFVAGVVGSVVTVWVTFVPCFLWIFAGAPYVEALRGSRAIRFALTAITAAVVGVILNLSIWFALHTLFGEVNELRAGVLRFYVPDMGSLSVRALTLSVVALVAMFGLKLGMAKTLAGAALLGVLWGLI